MDQAYDRVSPLIDDFDPDELTIMQAFRIYFMIQRESIKLHSLRLKIAQAGLNSFSLRLLQNGQIASVASNPALLPNQTMLTNKPLAHLHLETRPHL